MGDYRAYILGIDGHRFVWAEDFPNDQPHDGAAMNAARQDLVKNTTLRFGRAVDWLLDCRRVAK